MVYLLASKRCSVEVVLNSRRPLTPCAVHPVGCRRRETLKSISSYRTGSATQRDRPRPRSSESRHSKRKRRVLIYDPSSPREKLFKSLAAG